MKKMFFGFIALAAFTAEAQTMFAPAQPADRVTPTPALAASAAPTLPVGTTFGTAATFGAPPNNLSSNLSAVAILLSNLQTSTEQLLPWLASFNDSFDFATLATAVPGSATGLPSAMGFATNFSASLSPSLGSGSATNTFSLPAGFAASPQTRDTLRALLVLQRDLEQLLPTLTALNGATNGLAAPGLAPGFAPGAFTNMFGGGLSAP